MSPCWVWEQSQKEKSHRTAGKAGMTLCLCLNPSKFYFNASTIIHHMIDSSHNSSHMEVMFIFSIVQMFYLKLKNVLLISLYITQFALFIMIIGLHRLFRSMVGANMDIS